MVIKSFSEVVADTVLSCCVGTVPVYTSEYITLKTIYLELKQSPVSCNQSIDSHYTQSAPLTIH